MRFGKYEPALEFIDEDEGAVTVDWVVLTAAIVGIALVVWNIISDGVTEGANAIDSEVRESAGVD